MARWRLARILRPSTTQPKGCSAPPRCPSIPSISNGSGRWAEHFGTEDTVTRAPTGVFFGEPGKTVSDPYFGGEGPDRTGCIRCGACMVGCRVGAVNSLTQNYLWFAEKNGVQILPEHQVLDVTPIGAADGSDGYRITTEPPGAWSSRGRHTYTARGVIFAAGALGTNELLANCKHGGSLPRVSDRLGELVRTNSESVLTVLLPEDRDSGRRHRQQQRAPLRRHQHRTAHLRPERTGTC